MAPETRSAGQASEADQAVQWVHRRLAWERRVDEVRPARPEQQEETPEPRQPRARRRPVPQASPRPAAGQMVFGATS